MEAILACHPAVSTEWLAGWQFPYTMTYAHSPHWQMPAIYSNAITLALCPKYIIAWVPKACKVLSAERHHSSPSSAFDWLVIERRAIPKTATVNFLHLTFLPTSYRANILGQHQLCEQQTWTYNSLHSVQWPHSIAQSHTLTSIWSPCQSHYFDRVQPRFL